MSTSSARAIKKYSVIGLIGVLTGTLVSCSLFQTSITRDLRAVWSSDGESVLVVTSTYLTFNPTEPYHYSPSASEFEILLDVADGAASNPLQTRRRLDSFSEDVSQGGIPQYEPVYWYPNLTGSNGSSLGDVAIFGGRTAKVRYVDSASSWSIPTPRNKIATALGNVDEPENLSPSQVAEDMSLEDLVPSPDGKILAALYYVGYIQGYELGEIYEYRVVGFWDTGTKNLVSIKRVSDQVWHVLKGIDPYAPILGDDQNYVHLVWEASGSGVYVYLLEGRDGDSGDTVPSEVVFVPAAANASPEITVEVPERPLPTRSGPVSPDGRAFRMAISGNDTRIILEDFPDDSAYPAWLSFDNQPLVPVGDWLDEAYWFNF